MQDGFGDAFQFAGGDFAEVAGGEFDAGDVLDFATGGGVSQATVGFVDEGEGCFGADGLDPSHAGADAGFGDDAQ